MVTTNELKILVHVSMPEVDITDTFRSFWAIANGGWPLADVPPGRTDHQRNYALELLRQTDGTHLVILDHDHFHPRDVVERLGMRVMNNPEKLVIAGLNYSRHDLTPAVSVMKDEMPVVFEPHRHEGESLIEVYSTGAAAMIISREVVERVSGPWFGYQYLINRENDQLMFPGTDYWFSELMRKNKIKMWCDVELTSPHIYQMTVPELVQNRRMKNDNDA
jgi:hypothetical protein